VSENSFSQNLGQRKDGEMTERYLKIEGMTCNHCVMAVKKELAKIHGLEVKNVTIGAAVVAFDDATDVPAKIKTAIEEAGYKVVA
jgi:copper chaperone